MNALRLTVAAGSLAFVGLVAIQHPLRGDLPPAEHFISEYAAGSTGPLMAAAFACWAIALAAAAALAQRAPAPGRPRARRGAAAGFGLAAAGIACSAVFATQTVAGVLPPGTARTLEGRLHDLGTLAALAGLTAAAIASLRLSSSRAYRAALAALSAAILLTVPVLVALGLDAPGIGQRVFVLAGCAFAWRFAADRYSSGAAL